MSNLSSQTTAPTLSLAMIVKNEAEHLDKCLSTARPHVDEIVVVDTGSTDGTRAIAREYADVFDEIEWPDSFSLARNHSFDLATGDYIIVLDGDEHIGDPKDWKRIHDALQEPDVGALRLWIRNVLPERQLLEADCAWQIRVVRNHPLIRYTGRVHNQIASQLQRYCEREYKRVNDIKAEVVHVGYALSEDQLKEKYEPRFDLLHHEVESAQSPTNRAYYLYQLGVGYFITRNYEQADAVLRKVEYEHLNDRNAYYTRFLAGAAAHHVDRRDHALRHATVMMEMNPEEPLAYALAGTILRAEGDTKEAMLLYKAALKRNQDRSATVRFVLSDAALHGQIAALAAQLGLLKRAHKHYAAYGKAHPDNANVQATLKRLEQRLQEEKSLVR